MLYTNLLYQVISFMVENKIESSNKIIVKAEENIIHVNGKTEKVEPLTMRMLLYFYHHQSEIITRQQLMEEVWATKFISDEAINIGVSRLRKTLGGKRNNFIKTLPRKGYQFALNSEVEFELIETQQKNEQEHEPQLQSTREQEQEPTTQPQTKSGNRWLKIAFALFILATIASLTWYFIPQQHTDTAQQVNTASTGQIALSINPIKFIAGSTGAQNTVANQLKSTLELHQKFNFNHKATGHKTHNSYVIDIQINNQQNTQQINVEITSDNENIYHNSQLTFTADESLNNIIDELAAYIRLMLIYQGRDKSALKAYNPLSYIEVEQLVKAKIQSSWRNNENIIYAYDVVAKLNKKYPDVPQVSGLLSKLQGLNVVYGSVDIVKEKQQQLTQAKATLSKEPSNLDALMSAYSYHSDFAYLRDKASDYLQLMHKYHPNSPKTWRNQLSFMIDNMSSCDRIRQFIATIPQGVFKPHRTKVINQIIDVCLKQLPGHTIYNQFSFIPNNKVDKAIFNNLMLFQVNYDSMWIPETRSSFNINGPKYDMLYFLYQTLRGDNINAQVYLERIEQSQNSYWHWFAYLYLALHNPQENQQQELQLWKQDFFDIVHKDAELFLAALLVKQNAQTSNNPRLKRYLLEKQNFSISVLNRKESTARIMLLYLAGQKEEAQKIAHFFYERLESNYQKSPESFRFWFLGRYHLIAKMYCGNACQTNDQSPDEYLNQMFSPHHLWWHDDISLMEQALKPWLDEPLVASYLDKVRVDLQRVQKELGIR